MQKITKGGPSIRLLRVNENVRHALSDILRREDFGGPALKDVSITVTEVRTSPDLRNATVFVMPLGGENQDQILKALNQAAPYICSFLSRSVHLKYLPKLKFVADETFDESGHISTLLKNPKVAKDLEKED
jgi:ribosome-binding factor A